MQGPTAGRYKAGNTNISYFSTCVYMYKYKYTRSKIGRDFKVTHLTMHIVPRNGQWGSN